MEPDITRHLSAVDRGVEIRGAERVVRLRRTYAAGVTEVWDACTSAERLPRWFLPVSGELRIGGRYQLEGNAGGEVLECEPPHHLAVTWEFGETVSRVDLDLLPSADETVVVLTHTLPRDAHWDEFGPGAVGIGWEMTLLGLELHLVSGEPNDAGEFMAWTTSDSGRAFMTQSSDAWGRAHVAAGEDADAATAAAARTTAAYTAG